MRKKKLVKHKFFILICGNYIIMHPIDLHNVRCEAHMRSHICVWRVNKKTEEGRRENYHNNY
jgi:hypothetical protein